MLQGLRNVELEDVDDVREYVAGEIVRGMGEGTNVADLQQSLQDSNSGRSSGTSDMLRALGGGSARDGGAEPSDVTETPDAW